MDGTGTAGMYPYIFVTRKMTRHMRYTVCEIHNILVSNRYVFQLDEADMSTVFNHWTLIVYYAGKGLKKNSSLGMYCDCVYSVTDGKYIQLVNSQV